jgi:hypothetical protein
MADKTRISMHKTAVLKAAEAGKNVLCTKPLGRNGRTKRILKDKATGEILERIKGNAEGGI